MAGYTAFEVIEEESDEESSSESDQTNNDDDFEEFTNGQGICK